MQSKGLIYVVDDEEMIGENLIAILEEHNYEAIGFTNPSLVLKAVQERAPDLICTDMKMPEMSGLDLFHQMQEHKFDFPIIFITAFINNELLAEGMSSGISGFLEKPFEEHHVISLVNSAIERSKAWKLLNKSINYIHYQFNDLDKYLEDQGRHAVRKSLRLELQELLKLRKNLMNSMGEK